MWILWIARHPAMSLMVDLRIYRSAGSEAAHGHRLYQDYYSSAKLPFTYPPFAALLFAAIPAAIRFRTVEFAVTVCGVLSLVAVAWLSWGRLGYRVSAGRIGATALIAAVALWTEPVQQTFWYGQVNLVLMAAIVADLSMPEHWRVKGILTGLAAGFKLTPAVFIAYLLLTGRYRAALSSLGAFGATVAGCFLIMPTESRQYWGGLFFQSNRVGGIQFAGDQSLHGWIQRTLDGGPAATPVWLAAAFMMGVAGLLLAAWQYRAGNELLSILVTAVTGLLVSPISWSHHWVWVLVALVPAAEQVWRRRRVRDAVLGLGLVALLAAYPEPVAGSGTGLVPMGLIWRVPYNNDREYTWHGIQLIQGNAYTYAGLLFLLCLAVQWGRERRTGGRAPAERRAAGQTTGLGAISPTPVPHSRPAADEALAPRSPAPTRPSPSARTAAPPRSS